MRNNLKSITKIANYKNAKNNAGILGKFRWYDTIIDRSFKFVAFSTYAKANKNPTASITDFNIGTNNLKVNDSDANSRTRLFDKVLYTFYGLDTYSEKTFSSTSIANGVDTGSKSAFEVKTFIGLQRLLSDIYTHHGNLPREGRWNGRPNALPRDRTTPQSSARRMRSFNVGLSTRSLPYSVSSMPVSTISR